MEIVTTTQIFLLLNMFLWSTMLGLKYLLSLQLIRLSFNCSNTSVFNLQFLYQYFKYNSWFGVLLKLTELVSIFKYITNLFLMFMFNKPKDILVSIIKNTSLYKNLEKTYNDKGFYNLCLDIIYYTYYRLPTFIYNNALNIFIMLLFCIWGLFNLNFQIFLCINLLISFVVICFAIIYICAHLLYNYIVLIKKHPLIFWFYITVLVILCIVFIILLFHLYHLIEAYCLNMPWDNWHNWEKWRKKPGQSTQTGPGGSNGGPGGPNGGPGGANGGPGGPNRGPWGPYIGPDPNSSGSNPRHNNDHDYDDSDTDSINESSGQEQADRDRQYELNTIEIEYDILPTVIPIRRSTPELISRTLYNIDRWPEIERENMKKQREEKEKKEMERDISNKEHMERLEAIRNGLFQKNTNAEREEKLQKIQPFLRDLEKEYSKKK